MRNIRIDLEYEGTRYHGWQIQPNGITIQEELEKALYKILRKQIRVIGAGRTDAGVHAWGQTAHFLTDSRLDGASLQRALNSLLPADIVIKQLREMSPEFHARKNALKKRYEYWICNKPLASAFYHPFCWHLRAPLDVGKMNRAARYFIGEHDFTSFQATGSDPGTNPVRVIDHVEVAAKQLHHEEYIRIAMEGRSFLRHMVRIMVGTLVTVGLGKRPEQEVSLILRARDRCQADITAPAKGLFLNWVQYPPGLEAK